MSELIITIHRDESTWPGSTKRTRVTGYGVGVHSMPSEHWESRVEFVGRPRITAALQRGDIEVAEQPEPTAGGEV
jgi:hypothetical protein